MNNLSYTSRKIIISRLLDNNIIATEKDFNNYVIDKNNFKDLNTMYNFIVENWGKLIIE